MNYVNFLKFYGDLEVIKKITPEIKISVVIFLSLAILLLVILFMYKKKKINL